ncbi:succinate dehydrogenase/fumarate reductase iron-sulfur subunit [Chrysiogenes arsenatis]|uniref:succinate dehydrogenase/fumarate reductase iron-sulfur subunit n=1 Tax=Chrysiogenes arsenatis TaxID=309797 RepID=UPI00042867EE|nr:succinate dehydrogenase/fumarate reductase iron-sulfur subunit [Chrysiogenes arsenatis]
MSHAASNHETMTLKIFAWRQKNAQEKGRFEQYTAKNIIPEMSFLEMIDVLNEDLIAQGIDPIVFDNDCREGICGTCGMVVNGVPHGPEDLVTSCQLHMRRFKDGDSIYLEPWRAKAFPIIRDLVVDRTAMDKLIESGGYISAHTGGVPDGNAIPVSKPDADTGMDAAECIGCGACVAACPNGSAMLFVGAKVTHLASYPQGRIEAAQRVCDMTDTMVKLGFGNCSNHYECEAACPKGISVRFIAKLNREYIKAKICG